MSNLQDMSSVLATYSRWFCNPDDSIDAWAQDVLPRIRHEDELKQTSVESASSSVREQSSSWSVCVDMFSSRMKKRRLSGSFLPLVRSKPAELAWILQDQLFWWSRCRKLWSLNLNWAHTHFCTSEACKQLLDSCMCRSASLSGADRTLQTGQMSSTFVWSIGHFIQAEDPLACYLFDTVSEWRPPAITNSCWCLHVSLQMSCMDLFRWRRVLVLNSLTVILSPASPWLLHGLFLCIYTGSSLPPAAVRTASGCTFGSFKIKTLFIFLAHDARETILWLEAPEDEPEGPAGDGGNENFKLCL